MMSKMLESHLQKIANIMLERTPSQAMELLGTKLITTGKTPDKGDPEEEPAVNQMETDQGIQYQERPEVDVRTVRDERILLGK